MIHWRLTKVYLFNFLTKFVFVIFFLVLWGRLLKDLYFIGYFVTLLFYSNTCSCLDFDDFCSILQFPRLILKWSRGLLWIIILYDLLIEFSALHLSYSLCGFILSLIIYDALALDYLDIVIALLGFSFYCRQWQMVSCWNFLSTQYLSISRLAVVDVCNWVFIWCN